MVTTLATRPTALSTGYRWANTTTHRPINTIQLTADRRTKAAALATAHHRDKTVALATTDRRASTIALSVGRRSINAVPLSAGRH
jgi:hypothetical protein